MKFITEKLGAWIAMGAVLALAGCAAPQRSSSSSAAGTTGVQATAPAPISAKLRRAANNKWLLSFDHTSSVAEIKSKKIQDAKVVNVARFGNATTAMLCVNWDGCDNGYIFVGVSNNGRNKADVVHFDHPCSAVQPVIQTGHSEQYIDFIVGNRVKRYIYREGQELVMNRDVVLRAGESLPPPAGLGGKPVDTTLRYRPEPPFRPSAEQLKERPQMTQTLTPLDSESSASAQTEEPAPPQPRAPASKADLPGSMAFPKDKRKEPIVLDL